MFQKMRDNNIDISNKILKVEVIDIVQTIDTFQPKIEYKELVSSDKDEIASIIIGPGATAKDMGNPKAMMAALKKFPDKYATIKQKYFPDPGTNEWFRRLMNTIHG